MGTESCERCGGVHSEGECPTLRLGRLEREGEATVRSPGPPARSEGLATGSRLGRYEILGIIGRGGMGVVYRARDVALGREVALKVLLAGEHASSEALERFHREAALVARMGKHPHIVQVHDVGVEGARHFFTMDLVEGTSLRGWLSGRRAPREVMGLARKVADALAHAHSHGVVHRDLKADNVLVDAHGEPQVTDFGLAREVHGSTRLSLTGQVMGTPAFMAPEQAAGRMSEIGPWTDVYSFGAMLYDAFAGRPPHDEKELGPLLEAVMRRDPRPLRREAPSVSPEIETIVMKCLERRPEQRYRDGAALAAEVGRYLNGEPLSARPAGAVSRAWRRVRRNPAVSALFSVAVLLALLAAALGAWGAWSRAQAKRREQALVDDTLRELARSGDALVEAALARRALADFDGMQKFERDLGQPVRELKRRAPALAEPWYHEGRMKRAQGKAKEAETCQDEAISRATSDRATEGSRRVLGPALYERGILRAARYHEDRNEGRFEMMRLRSAGQDPHSLPPSPPPTGEVLRARPELSRLRDDTLSDLDGFLARGESGPRADAARAIADILRAEPLSAEEQVKALARAIESLRRTVESNRFFTEGYELLGGILLANLRYEEAERAYSDGHAADQGYLPFVRGAARALLEAAVQRAELDPEHEALLRRAGEWADRLISVAPKDAVGWELKSESIAQRSLARGAADEDPMPGYAEAASASDKAIDLDPSCLDAVRTRAEIHCCIATHLAQTGGDPREEFLQGIAGYKAVLAKARMDVLAMDCLANTCIRLADWVGKHGEDPSPWYEEGVDEYRALVEAWPWNRIAIADLASGLDAVGDWHCGRKEDPSRWYDEAKLELDRARALDPNYSDTLFRIGTHYMGLGLWQETQGKDPTAEYTEAKRWHEEALRLVPGDPALAETIAIDERNLGDALASRQEDPTEHYERALARFGEIARGRPRSAGALTDLTVTWRRLGEWQKKHGRDPREAFGKAVEAAEKAEALAPAVEGCAADLAAALSSLGDDLSDHGEDPTDALVRSARWYERSLELRPLSRTSTLGLALVWRDLADWGRAHGKDPSDALTRSIAAFETRMKLTPGDAGLYAQVAAEYTALGDWEKEHGADPLGTYGHSLDHLDRALALDAGREDSAVDRASVLVRLGNLERKRGGDAAREYQAALEACDRLLAKNPRLGDAHAQRGRALEGLGRIEEAVEAYRSAVALRPDQKIYLGWLVSAHFTRLGDAVPAWQRDGRKGTSRVVEGDLRGGRELLEESVAGFEKEIAGLAEAERRARLEDPVVRFVAGNAYDNLACALSLASAGQSTKRGEGGAVSDGEKERLRDAAFERLSRAIELGYANRSQIESDEDLAPLHDDARWETLRKRLSERDAQPKGR